MDMTYYCDKCGKPLDFNPEGNHKNKAGQIGEQVICNECLGE